MLRKYGTIESNVFQRTVDYPDEFANGHHVMLDTGELVTVRWEQEEGLRTVAQEMPLIYRLQIWAVLGVWATWDIVSEVVVMPLVQF